MLYPANPAAVYTPGPANPALLAAGEATARVLRWALDPVEFARACGLEPDPWQGDFLRARDDQVLLNCSRQSGKSTTTALLALHTALFVPNAPVVLLSPSLAQSQELFDKVAGFYKALGRPVGATQETSLRLRLANGSRIIALPGNEKTVRGISGVKLLVVDEASRVPDPLYYSVRPMLAVSGGRLVGLSTPFGKRGWFHDEWMNGGAGWLRVEVPAALCPRIAEEFLATERRSLGEKWFGQEYGCQFLDTIDQVFSYESVMAAVSDEVSPL